MRRSCSPFASVTAWVASMIWRRRWSGAMRVRGGADTGGQRTDRPGRAPEVLGWPGGGQAGAMALHGWQDDHEALLAALVARVRGHFRRDAPLGRTPDAADVAALRAVSPDGIG